MDTQTIATPPALIGYTELLAFYGLKARAIQTWMKQGRFPRPVHIGSGRLSRWRRGDVEAFIAALPSK